MQSSSMPPRPFSRREAVSVRFMEELLESLGPRHRPRRFKLLLFDSFAILDHSQLEVKKSGGKPSSTGCSQMLEWSTTSTDFSTASMTSSVIREDGYRSPKPQRFSKNSSDSGSGLASSPILIPACIPY